MYFFRLSPSIESCNFIDFCGIYMPADTTESVAEHSARLQPSIIACPSYSLHVQLLWCRQDIGTGVCGRSAWLLQQSVIWCQREPPSTFAECTECGGKIHHWCKKIRSHLSSVAWSSLVTSATKDNLQDRHFDAPVLERFGTSLPGDRLYRNLVDARPETVTICSIRTAIHSKNQDYVIRTKVVQGLWSHNLEWSACQIEGFFSEQKLFQKIA